ncbi:MAG: hypothetical protein KF757_03440 [Phycisphaeraceae bacterium]|nr:hypothetical protein [Phycisphaeraceae bacterium]MCW5763057.1 hypothetical protein [Phycisphaeraceae bacterium]
MNRLCLIVCSIVMLLFAPYARATPPASASEHAISLYEQAIGVYRSDPILARALFAQSAAEFTRALRETGHNPELYRALGNAALLSEQTGQAVLALNRALVLDPRHAQAREALTAARAAVQIDIAPAPSQRAIDVANSWRRFVSPIVVQFTFVLSWTVLWICIARSRSVRASTPAFIPAIAAILALISALALVASEWDRRTDTRIVVLNPTFGFNGPSRDVYEPTFEQTLPPGTEARAIESRNDWTRVRLRSGSETWIPTDTFDYVQP